MNITLKRAWITTGIFGSLFLFLVVYFLIIGGENFLDKQVHIVLCSLLVAIALISFGALMFFTNKKSNIVDERDYTIQRKASSVGLVLSLMYVFLVSMVMFVIYEADLYLPVGWLWFIAYSTLSFGYFITSLVHILYYYKEN